METSTRIGLFMTLGMVMGAIIGRWGFNMGVFGAIIGAVVFIALAVLMDKFSKT